ncbi:glycosyltransferase [Pistricoccus aurantiacus]|uniref:glycosyltransferase n=1 Tax=Pistricoccus aurantiacus TaxID=1883414 RepID=UPI00363A6F96
MAQETDLRTLVVVRTLKMGGMERVAVNLADAFAEAGHESHLLFFRKENQALAPEHPRVRVHHFPLHWAQRLSGIGLLLEALSRWLLNPLVRRSHFVWTGGLGGLLLRCWLNRFERRHGRLDRIVFRGIGTFEQVWSFRDDRAYFVLENILRPRGSGWKRRLYARCLFQGKHLVAVSRGVADTAEQARRSWQFQPASLSVIVNPCPLRSIRQRSLSQEPDLPSEPYIVNVARLVPAKDHALLLRAYARAQPREALVIVGDGGQRRSLEALARELGIAERVYFVGHRDNPYPWMRAARLFVLSSRFEGLGIVLLEALACGTPVLSVDSVGGIREVLKGPLERCIVARDEASLAEGITRALASAPFDIDDAWLQDFQPARVVERFLQPPAPPRA